MKKLIFLATFFVIISCENNVSRKILPNIKASGCEVEVIELDSCEYIQSLYSAQTRCHKGNCKYCQERMKKLLNTYFKK